ncbi:MAG: TonB-dependent receptor [Kiritimatiellae bacterium]|nr:TonB-dependent receptor [Kiritimatiellia bacterium]
MSIQTAGKWVVAGLVAWSLVPVAAAGTEEAALPEVVVTASRTPRDPQAEAATVYGLDARELTSREGLRTTPDLLKGLPSAMIQKTSYGQGSPFLRGFTGFRTLCLIEGIRLNNSVFRDGPNQYWNTVDPLSIARGEVVMGPGSVMYGSDAVGGTMNVLTLAPPEYDGQAAWNGRVLYRGATAEGSNLGRLQAGARPSEHLGFVGGVSLKDFGDLRGGKDVGKQEHTGYQEQDYDGRVEYYVNDDARFTLGHQTVHQDDAWRTHRTVYGLDWEGLTPGDDKVHRYDQDRHLTYLRYGVENMAGFVDRMEVTLSRHAQEEDLYRVRKDDTSDTQGFDVVTWGAAVQLESDTDAGQWVYGAEYYRDVVDSYARKYKVDGSLDKVEIQGPVADDAAYDSVGVYVQDTLPLFDGRAELTPGARYNYAKADADRVKDPDTGGVMSVEDDWDTVVGSLRLLVPLEEDRRNVLFAGVAQGYRAPNLSDLTRFDIARSGELETPAPDLDPERYLAGEIGFKSRLDRLSLQGSYYYTVIDDMIIRTPTGETIDDAAEVTKKNSGDGVVQGLELSVRYAFTPEWSVWAAGSLMDGRVDTYPSSNAEEDRDYVSRLMPPTAQLGLRWEAGGGAWWGEAVMDLADDADKLSADDKRDKQRIPPGGTPGYIVCALRAGTRLADRLDLAVALENLFDEDYRIHGSGVNEPGRNLVLTAALDL